MIGKQPVTRKATLAPTSGGQWLLDEEAEGQDVMEKPLTRIGANDLSLSTVEGRNKNFPLKVGKRQGKKNRGKGARCEPVYTPYQGTETPENKVKESAPRRRIRHA